MNWKLNKKSRNRRQKSISFRKINCLNCKSNYPPILIYGANDIIISDAAVVKSEKKKKDDLVLELVELFKPATKVAIKELVGKRVKKLNSKGGVVNWIIEVDCRFY